jgi:hypothetical protein
LCPVVALWLTVSTETTPDKGVHVEGGAERRGSERAKGLFGAPDTVSI